MYPSRASGWFARVALFASLTACVEKIPATAIEAGDQPPAGGPLGVPNMSQVVTLPTRSLEPGQTAFITDQRSAGRHLGNLGGAPGTSDSGGLADPSGVLVGADQAAPPVAGMEEGDIYRIANNQLFYLDTYRGFLIYDLTDPKAPVRSARLPVFGHPVEMYVLGNAVHILLRDSLHLTQVAGKAEFKRQHVSQFVTIDVTDNRAPKVVATIDIPGKLFQGVSRKVGSTIYVVSASPQSGEASDSPVEQAWVHSFSVADPLQPKKIAEYEVFEGGAADGPADAKGKYHWRTFAGVTVAAAAHHLMVAEQWNTTLPTPGTEDDGDKSSPGCGSYTFADKSHVSIIDVSDPAGAIRPQEAFWTEGRILAGPSNMTIGTDAAGASTTFFGLVAQQDSVSAKCSTSRIPATQRLEAWDVRPGVAPVRLGAVDVGQPAVFNPGASAFDLDRQIAYVGVGAGVGPSYVVDLSKPAALRIFSQTDLLGGGSVLRVLDDHRFLLSVGAGSCAGGSAPADASARRPIAIIDAADPARLRLVQRQCAGIVPLDPAANIAPSILSSDPAHKLLGSLTEGTLNLMALPLLDQVQFPCGEGGVTRTCDSAVGVVSWDLGRVDPTLPADQHKVIQRHGSVAFSNGAVRRSILFTHQATAGARRMMVNLFDTHVAVVDVQELDHPAVQADVEVAAFVTAIHRFGTYVVEQVQVKPPALGTATVGPVTFRVKRAGGDLDAVPTLASVTVDNVTRVFDHDAALVVFRQLGSETTEVQIVDFRNPAAPRLAGKLMAPTPVSPYFRSEGSPGDFSADVPADPEPGFARVERGLAYHTVAQDRDVSGNPAGHATNAIAFIDLRDLDAPRLSEAVLPEPERWGEYGFVADPVDPKGFYLSRREKLGESMTVDGSTFTQVRDLAERWEQVGDVWGPVHAINTPGRLIRTWANGAGERLFLAQDTIYQPAPAEAGSWRADRRLSLLRPSPGTAAVGATAALLDSRVLRDRIPSGFFVAGDKLIFGAHVVPFGALAQSESDHLMIIDASANQLSLTYDQPTGLYNAQVMAVQGDQVYLNSLVDSDAILRQRPVTGMGDGVVVLDISKPAAPVGVRFLRTLGVVRQLERFADDVYLAAGGFGLVHFDLGQSAAIPPAAPSP
jgi:hypothetical protein